MSRSRAAASETKKKGPLPIEPALLAAHSNPVFSSLDQWLEGKRVPPVLLLTGPRGCGKREIAYYLAQTLQCERAGFSGGETADGDSSADSGDEATLGLFGAMEIESKPEPSSPAPSSPARACGECPSCRRAIDGNSFDFREIQTEGESSVLKVDQFREIKESVGFSGFSGSYRIFLIPDAERMNASAANSMLKLLEEPPPGWVFLLTVPDASLLPSTIVSRCQLLRLRPLPEKELEDLLAAREIPPARIPTLVQLAEGSLSRAMELAGDEAWETRGTILQFLTQPQSAFSDLVDYAASESSRFRLLLDQFEQILADLIRRSEMPSFPVKNQDAKKVLEDHFARCVKRRGGVDGARNFWMSRSERLCRLRREMTAPLNQKVLVQDFLAPWMDAV